MNFISDRSSSIRLHGQPLSSNCILKFKMFSSKVASEEFVLRILKASPISQIRF